MIQVKFYNENGNVSVNARNEIRKQAVAKVEDMLASLGGSANANGGVSIPLAEDSGSGKTIYANIEITISDKDPNVKVERKKSSKKAVKETVAIPDLFANED